MCDISRSSTRWRPRRSGLQFSEHSLEALSLLAFAHEQHARIEAGASDDRECADDRFEVPEPSAEAIGRLAPLV